MTGKMDALSEHKELLIGEIATSAEWRAEKAQEYPEDARNEQSATALLALVENLAALAPTDPLLERIYKSEQGIFGRSEKPRSDDLRYLSLEELNERKSELLRRYGFDDPKEDGTDVAVFLSALADLTQRCAEGPAKGGDPETAA